MRRICFDTASNYFHDPRDGYLNSPEQAREEFRGKSFRFRAATAFILETDQSFDFENHEGLFAFLVGADEIITFNGRTCDLIMLESLVGEDSAKILWQKPHHDLKGWRGQSLESSVSQFPDLKRSYPLLEKTRYEELSFIKDDSIRRDLAGTYRDAKCTLDLFRLYLEYGKPEFTFR